MEVVTLLLEAHADVGAADKVLGKRCWVYIDGGISMRALLAYCQGCISVRLDVERKYRLAG